MILRKALYLIPVNLSEAPLREVLPQSNLEIVREIKYYIVENVRTARRFLKKCDPGIDIGAITFYELNRHTAPEEIPTYLDALRGGEAVGVMSEAGCPGVADPGAKVVEIAQRENLEVVPMVGPSSILLSLMGSGFNGQSFCFNGYLPIDHSQRERSLKELEEISRKKDMTQIFIETPYRNDRLLQTLLKVLKPHTKICVAANLTDPEKQFIKSAPATEWKRFKINLDKKPAIFLIYAR